MGPEPNPLIIGLYSIQIDTGTATNNHNSSFSFNFFEGKANKKNIIKIKKGEINLKSLKNIPANVLKIPFL